MSWYERFITFCGVGFGPRTKSQSTRNFWLCFCPAVCPDLAGDWFVRFRDGYDHHVADRNLYL